MLYAKLGIAPIAWWNDDDATLSDNISLDELLHQASIAGFTGMETGQRFPMNMDALGPSLRRYGISVCGGWFSGHLLDGDIEEEKDRIAHQLHFFKAAGAPCIVYGEIARSIQGERTPLNTKPVLSEHEMAAYARRVSDFADWCGQHGMPLSYHHHMGAVVEEEAELDLFMKHSSVPLLLDAGHLTFAGGDVLRAIDNHHARINHVHTKDVRMPVINAIDKSTDCFLDAVIKGAFTVPGDGSLDFEVIVKALAKYGYEGWFVVEAEQNPIISPPLEMAKKGHAELLRVMEAAGYQVVNEPLGV